VREGRGKEREQEGKRGKERKKEGERERGEREKKWVTG
jgi:hypothetical protein